MTLLFPAFLIIRIFNKLFKQFAHATLHFYVMYSGIIFKGFSKIQCLNNETISACSDEESLTIIIIYRAEFLKSYIFFFF